MVQSGRVSRIQCSACPLRRRSTADTEFLSTWPAPFADPQLLHSGTCLSFGRGFSKVRESMSSLTDLHRRSSTPDSKNWVSGRDRGNLHVWASGLGGPPLKPPHLLPLIGFSTSMPGEPLGEMRDGLGSEGESREFQCIDEGVGYSCPNEHESNWAS